MALLKCFELVSGQKLFIERFGDVTVDQREQIETKLYSDCLTHNHHNFWNTLRNWLHAGFDDTPYVWLILHTTQPFVTAKARLARWNGLDNAARLLVLKDIHQESENREHKRNNGCAKPHRIPDTLQLQREVMDTGNATKLLRIIPKTAIEASSASMSGQYALICDRYCKHVMRGKREDFIDTLFGFLVNPPMTSATSWEITYDEFTAKVKELSPLYCHETRIFPTKYLGQPGPAAITYNNQLFVEKIREIEYHTVITKAVQDFLIAKQTILEEFRNYEVSEESYRNDERELLANVFDPTYAKALRNVSEIIRDSQSFYDDVTASESPEFPPFLGRPSRSFRNGLLHMHMDDAKKKLRWRLGQ